MQYSWLNGAIYETTHSQISIADRGFLLGDGLYETLRIISGQAVDLSEHWQRLTSSAQHYLFSLSYSQEQVAEAIQQLINRNQVQEAVLRITLTRGPGGRGLAFNPKQSSTLLLTLSDLPSPRPYYNVALITEPRSTGGSEWSHKALHSLPSIRQYHLAMESGFHEALWSDSQGCLLEACTANVFLIKNGSLYTPPTNGSILPGITRAQVILLAKEIGISIYSDPIRIVDLDQFEAGFLTNSVRGILPIHQIENYGTKNEKHILVEKMAKSMPERVVC